MNTITLIIDGGGKEYYIAKLGQIYPDICIQVTSQQSIVSQLNSIQTDIIGYIPEKANPIPRIPEVTNPFLAVCPPDAILPTETAKEIQVDALAWMASMSIIKLIQSELSKLKNWTVLEIANILESKDIPFYWSGFPAKSQNKDYQNAINFSSILAIIPHYKCEIWLRRCLQSLQNQTRPLDGIVVVDDNSDNPPVAIIEEFPDVTLVTSPNNVGPYRLIQQVIEDTNYDAYLFQDADDWSSCDRLMKLLQAAARYKAQLVGTQEFRVFEESALLPVCYPEDVNVALAEKPGHALLHPTSLVTRKLVMQLGGFATGLRFGGDTEFLLRAAMVARIVNVPDYCYFRRKRAGSLTTAPNTGLNSPSRQELLRILKSRAHNNYTAKKAGKPLDLAPLVKEAPIKLNYVTGPRL
jgi:hypothetical protein